MRKKEANTREKIIKHALKIFAQKGYFRTTVDDIAQATGVGKGTVYLYFKDKANLYVATIDEHYSRGLDALSAIDAKDITPTQKMEAVAVNFIDYIKNLKTSHMLFTFENINLKGKTLKTIHSTIEPKIQMMIDIIGNIISQGIEKNEFREVDSRIAAFHFISTIRAIFLSNFYISNDAFRTDTMLKLFFEGLKKRR
jgi:AcrR family transcriptional regulator